MSDIIYKVYREPERRIFTVGYRGSAPVDAGYFFCPYIPGSDQEIPRYMGPTEFQKKLMESIKDRPMMVYTPRST